MPYLVRLTERALRDLEAIYGFFEAETSERAHGWFNDLVEAIHSLERFPLRGAAAPESQKLRQLFFAGNPNKYRIIYVADKRRRVVNILHIRHGARDAFEAEER